MRNVNTTTTGLVTVQQLCAALIRFDTTNHGGGRSAGESAIAEFIAGLLRDAGYDPIVTGPTAERSSVVLRVAGSDPALPGLLVHGHLDVVPAEAADWSVPPFAGIIDDGYVWGRGAADMKDMVAMTLVTLLEWASSGGGPRRDTVFAFVADEEDTGEHGALWLVEAHPELFTGIAAAIGESGGYPTPLVGPAGDRRLYPVATAERGTMHVRLTANGDAGHGSRPTADNAVLAIVDAAHRIAHHPWPIHLSATVAAFLERSTAAIGVVADLSSDEGIAAAVEALGEAAGVARYTIRGSATPTMLTAGYKVNVIPGVATAELDVRCPPGFQNRMIETIAGLVGDAVSYEFTSFQPPVEAPLDSPWFDAMAAAIVEHDPGAVVVPFCMGGGTDAKAFSRLGIDCYGFAPLGADPDGRDVAGVHGVDERVPVAALETGQRMLRSFLERV
jgi:acetylornithine deacetylase/succinyl-diaminopimelate desuccinylase-like protein